MSLELRGRGTGLGCRDAVSLFMSWTVCIWVAIDDDVMAMNGIGFFYLQR